MIVTVIVCSLFIGTVSSTVTCSAESGPCLGSTCPGASDVCYDGTSCCPISALQPAGGATTTVAPMPAPTTAPAASCVDKINPQTGVSDCPRMMNYCNDATYYSLMTEQCPKTCGRCGGGGGGGGGSPTVAPAPSGSCVDKLNPTTGVSDCPQRTAYCNNAQYYQLMTEQCPKTCGRC